MRKEPINCSYCSNKPCEKTEHDTLSTCDHGITFHNQSGKIRKVSPFVPLTELSKNLRHELNPILQFIVEQAAKIDNSISIKNIRLDKPASLIVASTIIIDHYIQMITGVNEFHTSPESVSISVSPRQLRNIVENYFVIHSIIKDSYRADKLNISIKVDPKISIDVGVHFIQFLVSLIVDNIWKHSIENSEVNVYTISNSRPDTIGLVFENYSKPLNPTVDIFQFGGKGDKNTKGFGYGLYWATILLHTYNANYYSQEENAGMKLRVIHKENVLSPESAIQKFLIENIICKS